MAEIQLKKRILISGAGGRVGKLMSNYFSKKNYEVYRWYHRQPERPLKNDVWGDLNHIDGNVSGAIEKCEVLLHLAAETGLNNKNCFLVNTRGTKNLLKEIGNRDKLLIYVSSIEAYGATGKEAIDENSEAQASSLYGKSKLAAEKAIINFCQKNKKLKYVILRPGNIITNRNDYNLKNKILNGYLQDYELSLLDISKLNQTVEKIIDKKTFRNLVRYLPGNCVTLGRLTGNLTVLGGNILRILVIFLIKITRRGGVYYYLVSGRDKYRRYSLKIYKELE